MAPYVMKIEIVNQTDYKIDFIGASTLSHLDGHTDVNGMEIPAGQTNSTEIIKSGGVNGLFTTLSWMIVHPKWDDTSQFSVYSEMPAFAGEDVFVALRDISRMSPEQFQRSVATDYNHETGKLYNVWRNPIVSYGTTVSLEMVKSEFPNSHARVTVTQDIDPSQVGSNMGKYEGKRVRSPDGRLYLVLDGKARYIDNMTVYTGLFGANLTLWNQSQAVVDAMPKGPVMTADPPLITPPGGGPIYFIDDGKKRWIQDPDTFNRYGFDWGRVVTVDTGKYGDGSGLKA